MQKHQQYNIMIIETKRKIKKDLGEKNEKGKGEKLTDVMKDGRYLGRMEETNE